MAGFDVQRIIAAHQAGLAEKDAADKAAQAAEDRAFTIELHKHQLKDLQLQDKLAQRNEILQNQALNPYPVGPEASVPKAPMMASPNPTSLDGSSPTPTAPIETPTPGANSIALPLPDLQIPNVYNEGTTAVPQVSMQQHLNAVKQAQYDQLQQALLKPETLAKGAIQVSGGKTIASNPEIPTPDPFLQNIRSVVPGFDKLSTPEKYQAMQDFANAQRAQVPGIDKPFSPAVTANKIAIAHAEKTAAESGDVSSLADMAASNPDVLKMLNPTMAGKVLDALAKSGRGLPNAKTDLVNGMVDKANETVQYLIDNLNTLGGGSGAVGVKGPTSLFGLLNKPMAGTRAADYRSYIDALKSQLTLPNLDMLKGLGRVTDREFKALTDAITALTPDMSEAQFAKELNSIQSALGRIKGRTTATPAGTAPPPAHPPTGGTTPLKDLSTDELLKRLGG